MEWWWDRACGLRDSNAAARMGLRTSIVTVNLDMAEVGLVPGNARLFDRNRHLDVGECIGLWVSTETQLPDSPWLARNPENWGSWGAWSVP
jgi:hypothetical protein